MGHREIHTKFPDLETKPGLLFSVSWLGELYLPSPFLKNSTSFLSFLEILKSSLFDLGDRQQFSNFFF